MADRRTLRLAQVKAWADCRRQYLLRVGDRVVGYDALTDEAFQDLRDRIASDVRWERRENSRARARRDSAASAQEVRHAA